MGLRFLQSTLLFPDVYWAIPPRAKTEIQSKHTGAVLERTELTQWGKKDFYMYTYFSVQQGIQRAVKGRKRSAEIMIKEIINLSLDLHLTCSEESSNVVVLFLSLLYLEPLLLPSQVKYQHEQEGIIIIKLLLIWKTMIFVLNQFSLLFITLWFCTILWIWMTSYKVIQEIPLCHVVWQRAKLWIKDM